MRAFSETQRFTQNWLILLLIVVFVLVGYGFFEEYKQIDFNNNKSITKFFAGVIIALLSLGLIFIFQLKTTINEQGIFYGFWPLQLKLKHITWGEIDKIYVREYNPIGEYGGWGYRFSFGKHGKAYNVSGTSGIQIVFKNGKKTLIGTQKKEDAISVLNTYKHKLNESNY